MTIIRCSGEPAQGTAQAGQQSLFGEECQSERHVNAIAGRLSLRKPQRDSLDILDRITEIIPQVRRRI